MKYLKMLGLAALAAMALMAVTAGSASATTLETAGVTQNKSVAISASLTAGTTLVLKNTSGTSENTCTKATLSGSTTSSTTAGKTTHNSYTGEQLTGPITALQFGEDAKGKGCTHEVIVHKAGTLHIKHIAGTTNGTLTSSGAEVTSFSTAFGTFLTCKTGEGTTLGTLTGTGDHTKHATVTVNAVLNCGFVVPSAKWEGSYTVTSPTGLGVSA
jgi:hypothetical protein